MAESDTNLRFAWLGCLLAVVHVWFVLVIAARLGILDAVDQVLFSTHDSLGYRDLSDHLWAGGAGNPRIILLRPFVYPVFLGLRLLVGNAGFGFLQLAVNAGSVILVFSAVRKAIGNPVVAAVSAAVLATNLSFGLIAFHALAESLALFFVAVHTYFLVRVLKCDHSSTSGLSGAALPIALGVCTKPALLPYWLVFLAGLPWLVRWAVGERPKPAAGRGSSPRRRLASFGLVLAATGPVLVQLTLTQVMAGKPTVSVAGRVNFEGRFFPVVYGFATSDRFVHYAADGAARALTEFPTAAGKLEFVAAHPSAAVRAAATIVWDMNLRAPSPFVSQPESVIEGAAASKLLEAFSGGWNRAASWLHLGFVPIWVLAVSRRSQSRSDRLLLLLLAAASCSVLLGTFLSYAQGDRLILLAMPAWLVLYPLIVAGMLSKPSTAPDHV